MIRRVLDTLYLGSGYLAALFLVLIAVAIILQVVGRSLGYVVDSTEIAGFFMAASSFFALAHTFKSGSHVRVTILAHALTGGTRRLLEAWCCLAAAAATGYLAWHAIGLAWQSWDFEDISPGLLAIPFWIPQSAMAAGLVLLVVALVDEAVAVLRGAMPSYASGEDTALD
ncbi:TRAP transporter small permease [Marinimicrococcus flavescens]|uniref:TRAP transporter small permease protein n=1 Tax=Marinimicrococcus flavescens TaxID=3031815 RepID=A0AAP3XT00_9PROT|nr:TRAP transporter small permease subunit [Marinimicrococcus flavescens]